MSGRSFLDPYGTGAGRADPPKTPAPSTPRRTTSGPTRLPGQDPFAQVTNPDAFTPDSFVDWDAKKGVRTEALDAKQYPGYVPPGGGGPQSLWPASPSSNNNNNRGSNYGYSTSAQAQADRDRELLWRTEDRDRDRDWRAEDRALDERLRAEQEAKTKEDRLKRAAAYDAFDTQMRDVYSADRVNARFDPMVTATGGAYDAGIERLGGITGAMTARGEQSRGDVANAFSAGDQRLQALRQQYQTQQGTMNSGFNDILSGYGAGSVEQGSGYMDRMFANAQTGNARAGTIYDASYADRGALVGGLQGDVETGMTRERAGLLAQIAGQRATAQQTSDSALAQALAQSGIARGNL
jgi:hypothetical protein